MRDRSKKSSPMATVNPPTKRESTLVSTLSSPPESTCLRSLAVSSLSCSGVSACAEVTVAFTCPAAASVYSSSAS